MERTPFTVEVYVDDKTGYTKAVYFHIRDSQSAVTKEILEGHAFADYNTSGQLVGIELLAPCNVTVLDEIAQEESEPVRRFLQNAVPRGLVLT
jgi:uncharacterized protein YuzE